jgi:hypothetical protein
LRREQSPSRKNLKILEQHRLPSGKTLLKVGVLVRCALARKVSARRLKLAVVTIAILAGSQLIWSGAHTLIVNRALNVTRIAAATPLPPHDAD